MNEVLPKSNESQLTSIKESIATFEKSVSSDSAKILTAVNKEEQLVHFITSFENKYNQLIQPFCAIVNSTEERLQKQLTLMKSSQIPENLVRDLTDFFNKYKNSSHKGQLGENQLETVLNQVFPTSEVLNTTSIKAACDFRVNRTQKESILFETKEYDRNVTLDTKNEYLLPS